MLTEDERLQEMGTTQLVQHALDELKMLVRAEVLHARQELRQEVAQAKPVAILFGFALGAGLCGIA